jgi:outer membrane protein
MTRRTAGARSPFVAETLASGMARIFSFSFGLFLSTAAVAAFAPPAALAGEQTAVAAVGDASAVAEAPPSEGAPVRKREKTIVLKPIEGAKLAIQFGNFQGATTILEQVLRQDPSSLDALFLMGQIESRQQKFAEAIPYYRKIIVDHPNIVRVRLDLARALFETGEDDSAEYNFHLALADGDLPATVIDNVERYLAIIRSRKHFVYDLNFGIAPDSNLNKATASDHVTLFGLPFALAPQARQQSGIGVTGTVSGEYRADLAPDVRWRTGALLYGLKYPSNSAFDDAQARGHMGPQWFFERGDVSVLGVVQRRWYGEQAYSTGVGGRIEGQHWLTKQLLLSSYVEGLSSSYDTQKFLDGYYLDQGNFLDYYITPSSLVRGSVGVGYQSADSDVFSNWYYKFGLAYQQEFAYGITANLAPEVQWTNYQATDPLFGVRRVDRQIFVKLSLYKRDFTILGFAPVVSYSYTTNQSNESLSKFDRNQFQLGFTRQF